MTRAPAPFPLERLADIPERPEDFRLLERIPLTREPQSWPLELSPVVGDEQPMVLLDTETTGLSADDESIIELWPLSGLCRLCWAFQRRKTLKP
ncbi:hypothetical protein [Marinomonas fungiae]|uniref:Exonuclease n=1 Tax=Marinomonas fungiae TaxID=1137284 RepID=A0A0K6IUN1_9GAMM|nr:hypothetical protein Ga0061065_12216 [Marinomonas fungiae]